MVTRHYRPANAADDWQALLADPDKHWRTGYSARALAHCWTDADGFPSDVEQALAQAEEPALHDLELLAGFPEHAVALPGGRRSSQNDIWLLARGDAGLVSIAVEGKVAEPFDKPVAEWLVNASPGRRERLDFLCETIGIGPEGIDQLRYQLFHRIASAVIEARRFTCSHALMLVHSFSQGHAWFEDFAAFASCYGKTVEPGQIVTVASLGDVTLSLGWVIGDAAYLER